MVNRDRKAVREFLLKAAERLDTDLSGLARRAGLAPSTVTRYVNGNSKHLPTTRTLAKIAEASGYTVPALGGQDRGDLLEAFSKFAAVLGIDLAEAGTLSSADLRRLRRAAEWLQVINRLPPTAEHYAFEMIRGVADAAEAAQQDPTPSEASRRRRRA